MKRSRTSRASAANLSGMLAKERLQHLVGLRPVVHHLAVRVRRCTLGGGAANCRRLDHHPNTTSTGLDRAGRSRVALLRRWWRDTG